MPGLPPVKSFGQRDLADDGERNWDDQVKDFLNSDYPDWQNPSKTYMVPQVFTYKSRNPDVGEKTEKNFFDLLLNLGESRNEKMFVVHSYQFAELISELDHCTAKTEREKSKRWLTGEHDFVIIHRQHGVVFFQVKAAIKEAKVFAEAKKQIAKDQKSLNFFAQRELKGKYKELAGKEVYSYPGFVVMPNCPKHRESATRPPNGVFAEDCENVAAFSEWWDKNITRRNTSVDQKVFNYLIMRFVGVPHVGHSISHCIDKSHRTLVLKTKEQLEVLVNTSPEQWITGPAGSGKTWLLMEKVKMLAEKALLCDTKEKILVVCYNKPLSEMFLKTFKKHLENSLQDRDKELSSVLEVKTFDKLLCDITRPISAVGAEREERVSKAVERLEKCPKQYDHVFVDECQDLYGNWLTLFKTLQKDDDDGIEPKHIWFLYDANQVLYSRSLEQWHLYVKRSTKLTKVFRNTEKVFQQSKKYYKSTLTGELTLGHRETGLSITWDNSLTAARGDERVQVIVKHINKLRQQKVQERDICILVKNARIRDKLSSQLQSADVQSQDAEKLYELTVSEENQNKIIVESIWRFKGLESKVVILFNPPFCEVKESVNRIEYLYTAVSRCFCYLVVITTKRGCKALQSKKGIRPRPM